MIFAKTRIHFFFQNMALLAGIKLKFRVEFFTEIFDRFGTFDLNMVGDGNEVKTFFSGSGCDMVRIVKAFAAERITAVNMHISFVWIQFK